jgi:hypothetical protein
MNSSRATVSIARRSRSEQRSPRRPSSPIFASRSRRRSSSLLTGRLGGGMTHPLIRPRRRCRRAQPPASRSHADRPRKAHQPAGDPCPNPPGARSRPEPGDHVPQGPGLARLPQPLPLLRWMPLSSTRPGLACRGRSWRRRGGGVGGATATTTGHSEMRRSEPQTMSVVSCDALGSRVGIAFVRTLETAGQVWVPLRGACS